MGELGELRYDSMWNHSDFISSSFVVFWLSCWFCFSAITWHRNLVQYDCGYFVSVSVCVCSGWESQLLETGFLGIFLCPLWSLAQMPRRCPPSLISVWTFRWLIVRIMLGAVSTLTCTFMPAVIYGKKEVKVQRCQTTSVWVFYGFCDWPITIVCQGTEVAM